MTDPTAQDPPRIRQSPDPEETAMDNITYLAIARQSGLLMEMQAVANNVANMSTNGFRREGVVFAELVKALPTEGGSISMAEARVRRTDFTQGALQKTDGPLDLAIEGEGFFMVQTPGGQRLTRSGAFMQDAAGALVTPDGYPLLDPGGAPIFVPPDAGRPVISADGVVSADGRPLGALAVVTVDDPRLMSREGATLFQTDQPVRPAEGEVFQGYVEAGNVNPIEEMSRMVEVHRAYELGQKMLDREDERIRSAIRQLGGTG